jgi:phospholipid/cholesterol/gamma-HCH transport system substrate-binding protein
MSEHRNELKVGVTLVLAGIVLVFGILWLGGFEFGQTKYPLTVVFPEVGGLVAGDRVTVAGVESGKVKDLGLTPDGKVRVHIMVQNDIKLPTDSRFSVASYGLIGAKTVAVRPGVATEYYQPGTTIIGGYDKGLGDVMSEMGDALTEIRQVLKSADEVISDREGRKNIKETLGNASVATTDLKGAAADLKVLASDLRDFVEARTPGVSTTLDSMGEASAKFATASASLERVAASLDSIVGRIESGQGSLGKLVNDTEAHDEFIAAVKEVRALVAEVKRNPKSFVKLSIF